MLEFISEMRFPVFVFLLCVSLQARSQTASPAGAESPAAIAKSASSASKQGASAKAAAEKSRSAGASSTPNQEPVSPSGGVPAGAWGGAGGAPSNLPPTPQPVAGQAGEGVPSGGSGGLRVQFSGDERGSAPFHEGQAHEDQAHEGRGVPQTDSAAAIGKQTGGVPGLYTGSSGGPADADPSRPGGQVISLEEAIRRSKLLDHDYLTAVVDKGTADAQRTVARADVLPNVDYHNQGIYTQPQRPYSAASVGTSPAPSSTLPIFIANNAVREYVSQGVVTETLGYGRLASLRQAYAEAAAAKARLEVARRGLVASVVGNYYGVLSANEKLAVSRRALDEANRFVVLSRQLEAGGESSHADVLKAQIERSQRERDLQDAELASLKARIDLGVLLFPDPTQPYSLATDLSHPPVLPTREEFAANTTEASPDVQAALASLRAAELGVTTSTAAYFPDLSLAYAYGIDSDHFAIHDPTGIRNLGYAATATVDIPVWDWFATSAKVKQSKLQRDLAKADLTTAQRRTLAAFQVFYGEAEVASRQLASLERSVEDSRQALKLTTDKYQAGEGAVLEVVDAQNTLTGAENNRADGFVRYYTALANLQMITGNLP